MSKEFKDIDELFRSTIGMGSATAPTDIKSKVMSKTGGGGNLWLIGAGLLLVTAVGAVLTVVDMPENTDVAQYKHRTVPEPITVTTYSSSAINDITKQTVKSTLKKDVNDVTRIKPQRQNESSTVTLPTINPQKSSSISTKPKLSKLPTELVINDLKKITINSNDNKTKTETIVENKVAISTQEEISTSEIKNASTTIENHTPLITVSKDESKAITDSNTGEIIDTEPIETVKLKPSSAIKDDKLVNEENIIHANLDEASEEKDETTIDSVETDTKIEINLEKHKGFWMVGLSGGPNINNANYTSSEFSQPLDKLHNEKLGYFGQVYGQYVSSNGLTASLGLGIEKQSYNTTFLTADTIYNLDGTNTVNLKDHYGITNSLYLQVPFQFGCQIERNKWIFGADLGIQINYLLKSDGLYLLNNEVLSIEKNSIFKPLTLAYSAGGNLKYNVFNRFYLSTNIRYFPSFQNYYESAYAKRAIGSLSLGFGLTYKW